MPKLKPNSTEEASRVVRSCISSNMELYARQRGAAGGEDGKDSQDHTNTSGTAGEFHSGRVMGSSQSAEADTGSGSQYCSGTDVNQ